MSLKVPGNHFGSLSYFYNPQTFHGGTFNEGKNLCRLLEFAAIME